MGTVGALRLFPAAAVVVATLAAAPAAAVTAWPERSFERRAVDLLNVERARRGLPRLAIRADLVTAARAQAWRMASARAIWHDPGLPGRLPRAVAVGDNAGAGPSVEAIQREYMRSSSHRANVLRRVFRFVGVGVVSRYGLVFELAVFSGALRAPGGRSTRDPVPAAPVRTVAILVALGRIDGDS